MFTWVLCSPFLSSLQERVRMVFLGDRKQAMALKKGEAGMRGCRRRARSGLKLALHKSAACYLADPRVRLWEFTFTALFWSVLNSQWWTGEAVRTCRPRGFLVRTCRPRGFLAWTRRPPGFLVRTYRPQSFLVDDGLYLGGLFLNFIKTYLLFPQDQCLCIYHLLKEHRLGWNKHWAYGRHWVVGVMHGWPCGCAQIPQKRVFLHLRDLLKNRQQPPGCECA